MNLALLGIHVLGAFARPEEVNYCAFYKIHIDFLVLLIKTIFFFL